MSVVFAAFLAGFAVVHKKRRLFADALDAIGKVAFAVFIPVYFAIVGLKLDLARGVSWEMMLAFLVGTCAIKVLSVGLAGRFAGFRGLDLVNLAITTNARGGPGIVLASSLRCGDYQRAVLHHAGCGGSAPDCRRMAGVCAAPGMAFADADGGQSSELSGHGCDGEWRIKTGWDLLILPLSIRRSQPVFRNHESWRGHGEPQSNK